MINLLPPARQKTIYKDLLYRQVNRLLLWAVIIFGAAALLILNALVFLKIQTRALNRNVSLESLNSQTRQAQELAQQARDLNVLLVRYDSFRQERISIPEALLELNKLIPSGVSLRVLSLDAASRRVIMSGLAASRSDVTAFENGLKRSAIFEKLDSPLSNFLESANVNFSFTFYVK